MPLVSKLIVAAVTVICAVAAGAMFWLRRETRGRARAETQLDNAREVIDAVKKANTARDRLRADPAFRDKLRARFRRDP